LATTDSLVNKVRVELGDLGKSFVTQIIADGTTKRFKIEYHPVDATTVTVLKNSTDITTASSIEESTGVLVLDALPADGDIITVSGTYFRYFTGAEMTELVNNALGQHTAKHTDSTGRKLTVANLPTIDEYPVAVYATTLALYALATDAAFDIDIQAPDGVTIPRAERYRQLMDMVQARQNQYRELCVHLGIGLYSIDVFSLRRISKATGRYVPIYRPQEVDDRSYPDRVDVPEPIYGDTPPEWPTTDVELTAYQGRSFSTSLDYTGNWAGYAFEAKLLPQRGSVLGVQEFALSVDTTGVKAITAVTRTSGSATITFTSATHGYLVGQSVYISNINEDINGLYTIATVSTNSFTVTGVETTAVALTDQNGTADRSFSRDYTFTLSLTKDQTRLLAERTYWSLRTVNLDTGEVIELKGGNFFTIRSGTVVV
jgi:hypothetical protein